MGVSGTGHYMPAALLDSQWLALERPDASEPDVLHAAIDMPVALIVANVGARLLHRPQDATAKVSA
jgi:gluconate kinase